MGKYTNVARLSRKDQDELFIDFVKSVSALRNSVEAANYIKDLLSESEVLVLARRLQIARLLNKGFTYQEVNNTTKASYTTIAKVQWWLRQYGDGYRLVLERTQKDSERKPEVSGWPQLKRKYPMYFWPQILLSEIIKSANKKEKDRLYAVIKQMKEKTKLSKLIEQILNQDSHSRKILQ